jgi:hypothetical protein
MIDIVNHGKYYNPSHLHYKKITQVQCDRCKKVNLDYCLGYDEYDLCFDCVAIINLIIKKNDTCKTFMNQNIKPKMMQDDFQHQTFMMQDRFNINQK